MAEFMQQAPLDAAMGAMPPGAAGAPGGAEPADRATMRRYGLLGLWAPMMARGYTGLAYSTSRDVRGATGAFLRRHPGLKSLYKADDLEDVLLSADRSKTFFTRRRKAGRLQTGTPHWAVIGSEKQVLIRGTSAPLFTHKAQKVLAGRARTGKYFSSEVGARNFITRGVFENAIIQSNLVSMQAGRRAYYTPKQLRAMGERFWRIGRARGGDVATEVFKKITNPGSLANMANAKVLDAVQGASAGLMPDWLAKGIQAAATHEKYGRLFVGGMRTAGRVLPIVSAYFTYRLIADITEWGTKKILRGLNWYYFKMPMQIYRAGTQALRRPILGAGTYMDSPGAQSERQRAVQAIQNSRLNARSALSAEAGLMHEYFG